MNFKKIKFQVLSIFLITSISASIIVNTYTHETDDVYSNENKESTLDVFSYDNINIKEYEVEDIQPQVAYDYDVNNRSSGIILNGDYTTSNILSVAKRGDIVIQEAGFGGITGHAAIIYEVTATKVITIEAVLEGVIKSELDSHRFFDRKTTLFSVKEATTKQIDIALDWANNQIGRNYSLVNWTDYNKNVGIYCSLLVWGAYKVAGIELVKLKDDVLPKYVLPCEIRDSNMMNKKSVSFKGYSFINQNSNKALDVPSFTTKKGAQVIQWDWNQGLNQQFIEISTPSSKTEFVYLPAHYVKMQLDVNQSSLGSGSGNNRKLEIQNKFKFSEQRIFIWSGNELRTKISGFSRCIVVENSSLNNGGKLIQYDRNGTLNSKWDKIYVSNVSFRFY